MQHLRKVWTSSVTMLSLLAPMPVATNAQVSKVKTVWVILMENHNWTGNNAGAAFGAPDLKGNLGENCKQPVGATTPAGDHFLSRSHSHRCRRQDTSRDFQIKLSTANVDNELRQGILALPCYQTVF